MAIRLANYEYKPPNETTCHRKLQEFLGPNKFTRDEEKPTIIQHYSNTFNGVDRFNKLLSHTTFLPHCEKEEVCILYSIFQIAFVQTWALDTAYQYDNEASNEHIYLFEYGKQLSKLLK